MIWAISFWHTIFIEKIFVILLDLEYNQDALDIVEIFSINL